MRACQKVYLPTDKLSVVQKTTFVPAALATLHITFKGSTLLTEVTDSCLYRGFERIYY